VLKVSNDNFTSIIYSEAQLKLLVIIIGQGPETRRWSVHLMQPSHWYYYYDNRILPGLVSENFLM